MKQPVFRRILLKLSGEALSGDKDFGIDDKYVINLCRQIKAVHDLGVQIAVSYTHLTLPTKRIV